MKGTGKPSRIMANVFGSVQPTIDRAEGVWMWDTDGHRVLDGCSGAVVSNIGHGVPEILDAITAQFHRSAFAYRGQFTSEPAELLASRLCELAGPDIASVFYASGGSEAVETAIKLVLQYWVERGQPQRQMIIGRDVAYHGATVGALSASAVPNRRRAFESVLRQAPTFAVSDCLRCPLQLTPSTCASACVDTLEQVLSDNAGRVAAVIIEPVGGASSAAFTPPPGYLARVRQVCDAHDVLMIADEVMTGGWRTGPYLAHQADGITADLVVLGKGLAAGYIPLSAVLVSNKVHDAIANGSGIFAHGYTYSGHPLAAAVANAVLDYCGAHDIPANVAARGTQLRQRLEAIAQRNATVSDVRGRGLMMGMEFADPDTGKAIKGGLSGSHQIAAVAREEGLQIYPCASGHISAVLIAPPLTITADEIDHLADGLERSVMRLFPNCER
jgi:adenosylmethionine-8-amino-7-oxononanoate aminotransferase